MSMRKLKKLLSAVLAVLAGSDTTSSALTHILYFLTNNPTIYKRLQAEIDGLGHKLTDCTAQAQLPYLNAVMYVLLGIKVQYLQNYCYVVMKVFDYCPLSYLAYSALR